jgi:hypothetical protein
MALPSVPVRSADSTPGRGFVDALALSSQPCAPFRSPCLSARKDRPYMAAVCCWVLSCFSWPRRPDFASSRPFGFRPAARGRGRARGGIRCCPAGCAGLGILADARLDVGDALARQRVAGQPGRRLAIHARRALQALEEGHHARRVVAGRAHGLEADAVGLALGVAAEIQLALDGQALPAHHHAHRRIGAAAGLADQRRQDQRRQRQQRILLLLAQHARDVALLHVADLVRQHRGQFRLVLRRDQQLRVHADEAAGQRERIDHRIAHGKEEEIGIRLAARAGRERHEVFAEVVQVLDDRVVVEVIGIAPDVVHDLLAQLALEHGRQVGTRGVAERRHPVVSGVPRRTGTVGAASAPAVAATRRRRPRAGAPRPRW